MISENECSPCPGPVNQRDKMPAAKLLCAVLLCALHTVALAQQAANINAELLQAVRRGAEATVRALLDQGASLESRNRLGDTPLNIAAKNGHTRLGLLLIERGADVNHKDLSGVTPLMSAAYNGDLELTRALLA